MQKLGTKMLASYTARAGREQSAGTISKSAISGSCQIRRNIQVKPKASSVPIGGVDGVEERDARTNLAGDFISGKTIHR